MDCQKKEKINKWYNKEIRSELSCSYLYYRLYNKAFSGPKCLASFKGLCLLPLTDQLSILPVHWVSNMPQS